MRLSFDIWSIFFLCAASQGYFLFFALMLAKQNRRSNRLLAFLILAITVLLTESLLFKLGFFLVDDHRYFIFFSTPVIYVIGPLFFMYAQSIFSEKLVGAVNPFWHFAPSIICCVNYLPAYFILGGFKPLPFMPLINSQYFFLWISGYVDMGLNILQTAVYLYFTIRLLKNREHDLKQSYANHLPLHVERLKRLTVLMIGLMGIFAAALIVFLLNRYVATVENILALSRAAVIYAIGYLAIKQPGLIESALPHRPVEKYQNSPLSNKQTQDYAQRLIQFMQSDKPYLNNDLKLPDLAAELSLSSNHLSQVLNQQLGVNFFDFVNRYRVREAQQKLLDPNFKHMTNLAIAFESGFSSKASFNRAFKKYTGFTPSQFVKSEMAGQQE